MKTFARMKVVIARRVRPMVNSMETKVDNIIRSEYEGMSYKALRVVAKAKDIFKYYRMDKEELLESLIQS